MRSLLSFVFFLALSVEALCQTCDPRHTPISEDEAWRISGLKACCQAEEGSNPYTFVSKLDTASDRCVWQVSRIKKNPKIKGFLRYKIWEARVDAHSGKLLSQQKTRKKIPVPIIK